MVFRLSLSCSDILAASSVLRARISGCKSILAMTPMAFRARERPPVAWANSSRNA